MLQKKPAAALVLLLLAAALAGCVSGPKYSKIKNSIPELNPEQGRIYFHRTDSSIVPTSQMPDIVLNGTVVGKVARGFFYIDRPPGFYVVLTKGGVGPQSRPQLTFALYANQTLYVQSKSSYGILSDRHYFELVYAEKALVEMQDLGYTGTEKLNTTTK